MSPKRRRARLPSALFALFVLLAAASLFVLDGAAAGVTSLIAMLVFIVACLTALRGQEADVRRGAERTGVTGWFGGWF